MSGSDIISRIKEAESKAELIVKTAYEEANKLLLDAKIKSKEILHWKEADARAEAEKIYEACQKDIEKSDENNISRLKDGKLELEKSARSNMKEALERIKSRFFKIWQ